MLSNFGEIELYDTQRLMARDDESAEPEKLLAEAMRNNAMPRNTVLLM